MQLLTSGSGVVELQSFREFTIAIDPRYQMNSQEESLELFQKIVERISNSTATAAKTLIARLEQLVLVVPGSLVELLTTQVNPDKSIIVIDIVRTDASDPVIPVAIQLKDRDIRLVSAIIFWEHESGGHYTGKNSFDSL